MVECPFCEIAHTDVDGFVLKRFDKALLNDICDVVMFTPLNPCVTGHLLFVPSIHIDNIGDTRAGAGNVVAATYKAIQLYLSEFPMDANIITNNEANADQTVFHLHVHLIPREFKDGVTLPWTWQKKEQEELAS